MNKILNKLIWPIMLAPLVYLAIIWKRIPDQVAVHFDLYGNPDRYGSKNEVLVISLVLGVVNIILYLILTNIYRFDPKKGAVENKNRLRSIAFATAVFMSGVLTLLINSSVNTGIRFDVKLVLAGVGLLFAIIGNYMPNVKPNYFAGIRLPWTLENPDNWKKTHALMGKLWFAGGLFLAVICLFLPPLAGIIVFIAVTMIITIIPGVYSYKLFKKNKAQHE
jgi:uncharacterized membrane protein